MLRTVAARYISGESSIGQPKGADGEGAHAAHLDGDGEEFETGVGSLSGIGRLDKRQNRNPTDIIVLKNPCAKRVGKKSTLTGPRLAGRQIRAVSDGVAQVMEPGEGGVFDERFGERHRL